MQDGVYAVDLGDHGRHQHLASHIEAFQSCRAPAGRPIREATRFVYGWPAAAGELVSRRRLWFRGMIETGFRCSSGALPAGGMESACHRRAGAGRIIHLGCRRTRRRRAVTLDRLCVKAWRSIAPVLTFKRGGQ